MGKNDSRKIDTAFVPGRNFADQSARSSNGAVRRCEYVPSRYLNPDFTVLDTHQAAYYRYWKDSVSLLDPLRADIGYVNLFISETLLSEAPAEVKVRRLLMLYRNADSIGFDRKLITGTVFDLAVSGGLPLPVIEYSDRKHTEAMVSGIFAHPFSRITAEIVRILTGTEVSEEVIAVVDSALRRYDTFLSSAKGSDLLRIFDESESLMSRRLFADRPFLRGNEVEIRFPHVEIPGKLVKLLENLCKAAEARDHTLVPKSFGDQIRAFLKDALEDPEIPVLQYTEKVGYSVHRKEMKTLFHEFDSVPPCSPGIMRDLSQNWENYSRKECPYVPSGSSRTEYALMDDAQLDYYRYWKGCMVEGRHLETDNGYVWLYMSEQLANCPNTGTLHERLKDLYGAYGRQDHSGLIRDTLCEFCIANGLQIPCAIPSVAESAELAMMGLLQGKEVSADSDCLLRSARLEKNRIAEDFDEECARAVVSTINDIRELLETRGISLSECFPCGTREFKVHIYSGLRVFGGRKTGSIWAKYPALSENMDFCDFMESLIVNSVKCRKRLSDGRNRRPIPYRLEGIDCELLVEKNVYNLNSSRKKQVDLNLDYEVIGSAERDLDIVTQMMSVPEEDAPKEKVPEQKTERRPGKRKTENRWRTLVDGLNDLQRNYLLGAINGKISKVDHRIEDAINDAALEIVEDTIIEAGKVYEDYEDDVRSGF